MDIQAIAHSVLGTRADLDVLRDGVPDLAESFDNRMEELRKRFVTEVDRVFDENRRNYELAHDRRIDDHKTLPERFEQLKSNLNDRLVEFLHISSLSTKIVRIPYA